MYTILIVDDELEIRELLNIYIENNGMKTLQAENGRKALELLEKNQVDLALVDINMPVMNGYQLVKIIREKSNIPIIFISAKSEQSDKVLGLGLGADDYITKPFNALEVVARIQASLRRSYQFNPTPQAKTFIVKDLVLDLDLCILYKNDGKIDLTSTEFKIIKLLMESPGKVFTKNHIFEVAWGVNHYVDDNTIMVSISKLRAKIDDEKHTYIKNIRGLGYRIEV